MKHFHFLLIIIWVFTGKIIAQNPFPAATAVQLDTNYTQSTTFKSTIVTAGNGSNAASISGNSIPAVDGTDIRIFPSSNPQSEVNISIDPTNSKNILVTAQTVPGNSLQGYYYSNDGGQTWHGSDHLPNSAYGRGDPCTAFDAQGNGYIVSLSPDGNNPLPLADGYYLMKTTDHGATWQNEIRGYGPESGVDKEMIAIDNLYSSPYKNNFYCAWTEFTGTYSGYVKFNSLPAGGNSFSSAITLRSNTKGWGQGANVQTGPDGEVYVCWADYPGSDPATGIGFTKSLDGGITFSPGSIAFAYAGIRLKNTTDSRFNCRMNDFPSMAVDKSNGPHRGRIYIAYPTGGSGTSVIQVRYSDDQGSTWSQPKTVSISGATQSFFPWITVDDSTGIICIAYYAFDTSVQYGTDTYLAYSSDCGQTFSNIKVSDASHITDSIAPFAYGGYAGDYIGVAAYGGTAYPAWMDDRNGTWQIYVSPVHFVLPSISGDSTICTSGSTFTLNNLPSGATVNWIQSSNLSYVSGQGTNNYTVQAANSSVSGMGWVKAIVSSSYGNDTIEKNVWVGKPGQPITDPPGYPTYQMTLGQIKTTRVVSAPGNPYEYVWKITGSITKLSGGGTQCTVEATTTGTGNFYVNSINVCDTSVTGGGTVYVSSGGGGGLLLSPNPANNILTVEISNNNTTDSLNNNGSKSSELRVYDKIMNLKMEKTFEGTKTQINVRNLKQGVYILQIISGNKNYKKEIMVSHR